MNDFERATFDGNVPLLVARDLGKKLHELEQAGIQPVPILPAPTLAHLSLT